MLKLKKYNDGFKALTDGCMIKKGMQVFDIDGLATIAGGCTGVFADCDRSDKEAIKACLVAEGMWEDVVGVDYTVDNDGCIIYGETEWKVTAQGNGSVWS